MKSWVVFFILLFISSIFYFERTVAQTCENWTEPQALTSDDTDNRNATLVRLWDGPWSYYLFWQRSNDSGLSEIVFMNYYQQGAPQTIVYGDGFTVSNPEVIVGGYWAGPDTLGYLFYETNQNGNGDIYYWVWTYDGFSNPVPFANTGNEESNLSTSNGGGIVWQENDKVNYSRLEWTSSGAQFSSMIMVDSGQCFNPVIHHVGQDIQEEFLAWEKGDPENPEIWYCKWDWQNEIWGEPVLLFSDGSHTNIRFSRSFYDSRYPLLLSDFKDEDGNYGISAYDFSSQDAFSSEFRQQGPFHPDYFAVDPHEKDFWNYGYLCFEAEITPEDFDIYSSDHGFLEPYLNAYCCVDRSTTNEVNPQFFEALEGGDCFNLDCIWESYRNGYWQLYSCYTLIISGGIDEKDLNQRIDAVAKPNPFFEETKVSYSLETTTKITVSIYNANGQFIRQSSPVLQNAGFHEVTINMLGFSTGIYLIKVDSENGFGMTRVIKN